jgi:hypothetical protein
MSKSVAAPRAPEKMSSSKNQPAAKSAAATAPKIAPFKPHRKLAIVLLVLFIVWMVLLYVMYFTTVYGHSTR